MSGSTNEPAHGLAPDETFPGSETDLDYAPALEEPARLIPPITDDDELE